MAGLTPDADASGDGLIGSTPAATAAEAAAAAWAAADDWASKLSEWLALFGMPPADVDEDVEDEVVRST